MVKMAYTKKYLTHDNGGRSFVVLRTGTTVDVFMYKGDGERLGERLSHYTNVTQFFEGEDPVEGFLGNSVLFGPINGHCSRKMTYVFVGRKIFSFTTSSPVTDYVSPVGNNDVPYLYAVTCDRVYLMGEGVYIYKSDLKERDYTVESYTNEDCPYFQYYRLGVPEEVRGYVVQNEGFANGHEFPMDLIQKRLDYTPIREYARADDQKTARSPSLLWAWLRQA